MPLRYVRDTDTPCLHRRSAALHRDDRALTAEEEDYFNADDDDDDESTQTSNGVNGISPTDTLVPAKRSDVAEQDGSDIDRRKRQKFDSPSSTDSTPLLSVTDKGERTIETTAVDDTNSSAELSQPTTDPEVELARIREKRKRAEDEEDDEDFLTAKKMSQDSQKEKSKVGLASMKNKNVSGKLKLFFGKKT